MAKPIAVSTVKRSSFMVVPFADGFVDPLGSEPIK